jgi:hypothetical protein
MAPTSITNVQFRIANCGVMAGTLNREIQNPKSKIQNGFI